MKEDASIVYASQSYHLRERRILRSTARTNPLSTHQMSEMSTTALDDLRRELSELDLVLKERLRLAGFDVERLIALARPIADAAGETATEAKARREARNRVTGEVSAPALTEIRALPETDGDRQRLFALGLGALSRGEVALCVMAGGMATRMGGVVKALVEVLKGHTFLDLRLRENEHWSERIGRPLPLWLMTSEATEVSVREALRIARAPAHVKTFTQDIGLRVTPEGRLFRGNDGEPSVYATGHGDLVDALRRSGILRAFRESGGRIVWITNLDNLGATIDPTIIGAFLELEAYADVMVEVVDKGSDKGGIPVHALGRLQVLEEFRLPEGFDASQVTVFNTNTFVVKAEPLETAHIDWNWFEVEKKVDGKVAVQFERLLQELTAAMPAACLRVPREGVASRFLPVKDVSELEQRRGAIEDVARARGMLS
jgi:UTP--glucose-1-phosphate uridylyltransferase